MTPANVIALAERLKSDGFDAFFAWSEVALGYLHGYHEHAGHRFLTLGVRSTGECALICGALSENQARRSGIEDVRAWRDGEDPLALMSALAEEWGLRSAVLAVDEDMPALMLLRLENLLPGALFRDGGPALAGLRRRKGPEELALLRRAATIADEAYEEVKPRLRAGMTERQAERLLFDAMERRGGRPNFGIVAAGANGAEPHHATDDTAMRAGDVVVLDFGCDVEGYRSDITRCVALESADDEARRVYALVYAAHMAGRAAVRAGRLVGEVDAAARSVIEAGGHGPEFMHRLGHGLGLQGHELPYIVPGGQDALQVGDVFSIEPGVYLAGRFGVRIENILVATEQGGESLNAEPSPELEVVG